jgi:hypothetical protein
MRWFIGILCLFVILTGCVTSNDKIESKQLSGTNVTPCIAPIGGHSTTLNEQYQYSPSPRLAAINRSLLPHIIPDPTKSGWTDKTLNFNDTLIYDSDNHTTIYIQNIWYRIHVQINNSVYYGAKTSSRNLAVFPYLSNDDNLNLSYTAMIEDPNQNEMYSDLLNEFHKYRDLNHLDDDEYLEFITRFVQSIPYNETNAHKYPIEVVFDNSGVCDDKSKLLAGLLEREGYDVALFIVKPKVVDYQHMFVGVKSNGLHYNGTIYAMIDTTTQSKPLYPVQFSYIGQPSLGSIEPHVIIIKIGNGTKGYTKTDEISTILTGEDKIGNDLNYKLNCPSITNPSADTLTTLNWIFTVTAPNRNSSFNWFKIHNDTQSIPDKITFCDHSNGIIIKNCY